MKHCNTLRGRNASGYLQKSGNPELTKIDASFGDWWEQNATQQEIPEPPPKGNERQSKNFDGIYYQSLLSAVCDRELTESLEILEGIGIRGDLAIRCISFLNGAGGGL